jgi:hypothetical protein
MFMAHLHRWALAFLVSGLADLRRLGAATMRLRQHAALTVRDHVNRKNLA